MLVRILFCTILLLLLSACGFKLRGYVNLPEHLKTLKILPSQPFDPFQKRLLRTLKQNQVTILPAHTEKISSLEILEKHFKEETVSYAPDGTAVRARLTFSVRYQILDQKNQAIVAPTQIQSVREFNVSSSTALSDQTERTTLKEELRLETVHKILRQLAR